jgi:hypothetical protein
VNLFQRRSNLDRSKGRIAGGFAAAQQILQIVKIDQKSQNKQCFLPSVRKNAIKGILNEITNPNWTRQAP